MKKLCVDRIMLIRRPGAAVDDLQTKLDERTNTVGVEPRLGVDPDYPVGIIWRLRAAVQAAISEHERGDQDASSAREVV